MEQGEECDRAESGSEGHEHVGTGRTGPRGDLGSPVVAAASDTIISKRGGRRPDSPNPLLAVDVNVEAPAKVAELPDISFEQVSKTSEAAYSDIVTPGLEVVD